MNDDLSLADLIPGLAEQIQKEFSDLHVTNDGFHIRVCKVPGGRPCVIIKPVDDEPKLKVGRSWTTGDWPEINVANPDWIQDKLGPILADGGII
jgi:hypothetical protein